MEARFRHKQKKTKKKTKVIATFYLKNQSFFLAILTFFLRIVRYKLEILRTYRYFFPAITSLYHAILRKKVIKPELWDKKSQ